MKISLKLFPSGNHISGESSTAGGHGPSGVGSTDYGPTRSPTTGNELDTPAHYSSTSRIESGHDTTLSGGYRSGSGLTGTSGTARNTSSDGDSTGSSSLSGTASTGRDTCGTSRDNSGEYGTSSGGLFGTTGTGRDSFSGAYSTGYGGLPNTSSTGGDSSGGPDVSLLPVRPATRWQDAQAAVLVVRASGKWGLNFESSLPLALDNMKTSFISVEA